MNKKFGSVVNEADIRRDATDLTERLAADLMKKVQKDDHFKWAIAAGCEIETIYHDGKVTVRTANPVAVQFFGGTRVIVSEKRSDDQTRVTKIDCNMHDKPEVFEKTECKPLGTFKTSTNHASQ